MNNFLDKLFEVLTQNLELILGIVGVFAFFYILIFCFVLVFVIKRFKESSKRREKFFEERKKMLKGMKR